MAEKIKKVLVVLPDGRGGAERQSIRIASYLPADRFRIVYVIIGATDSKITGLLPPGAQVRHIRIRHIWQGGIYQLFRCFKKERPYAVFSSFHYLNGRCILAARLAGIQRTVIRGNISIDDGDPVGRLLMRLYYKKASAIICQTDELREEMIDRLHVLPDRVHALYNPVDGPLLERMSVKEASPFGNGLNIVCVGRICPKKGQDVLLRAFDGFRSFHEEAHLYFLGDVHNADAYYAGLQEFIVKRQLQNQVHFEGFKSNPWVWIKNADCLVLPSYVEGLPNVLIEAQYLGTPCVATASVQSISRIIEEGVNGYIVPVGNAEALCNAIEKALSLKKKVSFSYKPSAPEEFISLFV